jgi:D-glycero-alpha-D-manno-heptose-7-phosphate kinase
MKIIARAPCRVDPAGGGTDAPPYCIEYGGAVVNFSVSRHAFASFERLPKHSGVIIYSRDSKKGVRAASVKDLKYDGQIDFLKAFVKRMLPNERDFLIVTQSEVPERTGLGGSGALGVAMVGAIARALGRRMNKSRIALLANEIERLDLGHSGGNQDSFGAAIGGIKLIHYHKGGGCDCRQLRVSHAVSGPLERDSLMIYTGEVHLSGTIHADIKKSYAMKNSPTIKAMNQLKASALRMARALEKGDLHAYDQCLNAARQSHYDLHESCDSSTLRSFFKKLTPHIRSGKTCGAGGGGFIFVHAKQSHQSECVRIAEDLGGKAYSFKLDDLGVIAWEEAPSTAAEIKAIRAVL